jgi:hypothetical protein
LTIWILYFIKLLNYLYLIKHIQNGRSLAEVGTGQPRQQDPGDRQEIEAVRVQAKKTVDGEHSATGEPVD